tara:strand:- start:1227 stop:1676 length:450 start_codon:yes stop_codon:yes gene_type:complete
MDKQNFSVLDLENHVTRDVSDSHINGELTIIWRDWDNMIKTPEMIYVNTVNPREIKGPHLHKERTSYFYCINGEIVIILQDKDSQYHEIKINSEESKLVAVSNGIPAAIVNPSDKISKILVLADRSWKPNDNEMSNVKFENYNFDKWKF